MSQTDCVDIIRFHSQSIHVQYKRFLLYRNTGGSFLVLIRKLKSQDAGTYRIGVDDQSNSTVNLKVRNGTEIFTVIHILNLIPFCPSKALLKQ